MTDLVTHPVTVDLHLLVLYRLLFRQPALLAERLALAGSASVALQSADLAKQVSREVIDQAEADLVWLDAPNHHLILRTDPDFPDCLAGIYDPPFLLFARGQRESLAIGERVAIVGARKASLYGSRLAASMAETLAANGVAIVSGLAMGIDAAAHEGALSAGGTTLAVLGTGCDLIYPRKNWRLAEQIERSALILSELPLGMGAFPSHFPRRNRIVTGLSRATLVVEAAVRSGSLISARLALSEGREVMAVPGLVTNPQARGCHELLREGAILVESAEDILTELGLSGAASTGISGKPSLSAAQQALVDCLEQGRRSVDSLAGELGLAIDDLTTQLVTLEILGIVQVEGGHYEISPRTVES